MAVWPEHKGPITGNCPECNGVLKLRWSDRIYRISICEHCGLVVDGGGVKRSSTLLGRDINVVFDQIGKPTVNIYAFLSTLNVYLKANGKQTIKAITKRELSLYGLELISNQLKRK